MIRLERCDGLTAAAVADASGRTIERNDRSCKSDDFQHSQNSVEADGRTHEEERGGEEGVTEDGEVECPAGAKEPGYQRHDHSKKAAEFSELLDKGS